MRRFSPLIFCLLVALMLPGCQTPIAVTLTPVPSQVTPSPFPSATSLPSSTPTAQDTATPTPVPCMETHGKIFNVDIPTDQLNQPVNTNIYLPPCYDPDSDTGYPVLFMFHGQAATNDQWIRLGLTNAADELITQKVIQPMIIVMPFEVTWTPGPEESRFDEAFMQDVLSFVESEYAVCAQRSCRAVGGLSRGGNWAVYLGFAYPELFGTIGAHSTPLFYGEVFRINQAAGKVASFAELPWVIVDMGDRDAQKDKVLEFTAALQDAGIPFDFYPFEGRHEESYWGAHVADYLQWYSDRFIVPPQD